MAKKPVGRPTLYKEEYCQQLEDWMAQGMSINSFGAEIGTCVDTLMEWLKVYPDFSASYKRGRANLSKYYENAGRAIMMGKVKNANATAWVFLTKNHMKWTDRHEHTGDSEKPITLKYSVDGDEESNEPEPQSED